MATHKINQGQPYRYTAAVLDVPAAVTKAWLTVKRDLEDPDVDAVWQKEITTVDSADGVVLDDGGDVDMRARVRFEISRQDSDLIVPGVPYVYDIQVLCDGDPLTSEYGTFQSRRRVTQAVA